MAKKIVAKEEQSYMIKGLTREVWRGARSKSVLLGIPIKKVVGELLQMWVDGEVKIPSEKEGR